MKITVGQKQNPSRLLYFSQNDAMVLIFSQDFSCFMIHALSGFVRTKRIIFLNISKVPEGPILFLLF